MKSKILIITDELYPFHLGGAGVVVNKICNELNTLDYEYDVFCSKPKKYNFVNKLVYNALWPFFYLKLLFYVMFNNYNKIIVNDLRSAYFIGLMFRTKTILKCSYIVHGTEAEIVFDQRSYKNTLILLHVFYLKFLKHANKIVFVSKFTHDNFIKSIKNKLCIGHKSHINYVGLDADYFTEIVKVSECFKNETDANLNIVNNNQIRLVSFSRLEARKGYFDMYLIFKQLLSMGLDVIWHIYGSGSISTSLQKIIENDNLGDKILMLGSKNRCELIKIVYSNRYDVFWLLPNLPEAFGLTYIESAAMGLPSIAPNIYGIKESICHEQ